MAAQEMLNEKPDLPALPTSPMEMVARAVAHNATPETLERLLALQERYETNQARKAYAQAIAKARGEIGPIFKSAEARRGPAGSYRYEQLDDIDRQTVPILSKYGLSYRWNTRVPDNRPDWVIVTCKVEHRDGHFEENSLGGPVDTSGAKNPIQAIGSAVTYLCRYTVKAALGLSATVDTDANEPDPADERTHDELDAELGDAAEQGMLALESRWNSLPKTQQQTFKAALDRRYKPAAQQADARRENETDAVKQAGMRCADPRFHKFLEETNTAWKLMTQGTPEERAAELVRAICGVKSRKDLASNNEAAEHWHDLEGKFQAWLRA